MSVRTEAAKTLAAVLRDGASLNTLLPQQKNVSEIDRGLYQELCYGTLRWYPRLNSYLKLLLEKPFKPKDLDIQALLACALYQLTEMRTPTHAAVNESVASCSQLKKSWAKGLVNAVLRKFLREKQRLDEELATLPVFLYAHPNWMIKTWQGAWPEMLAAIATANNGRPPMILRVNCQQSDRDQYLQRLAALDIAAQPTSYSDDGIVLKQPIDVAKLPGFEDGVVSVQDEAAQLATPLLQLQPGQRILDACCAPGGKTCHILEQMNGTGEVVALDADEQRLKRVAENMRRLDLQSLVITGDAARPGDWWDGQPFDRILLDAPCSATGVIRRHPDIKLLRKPGDIDRLAATQLKLLTALWPLLKPGGMLLYATCSTLPQENDEVISRFLDTTEHARAEPIQLHCGIKTAVGRQLLPQVNGHDGFYYATLTKLA